jgi:LPXTG-motif cell wall-anchored protein
MLENLKQAMEVLPNNFLLWLGFTEIVLLFIGSLFFIRLKKS